MKKVFEGASIISAVLLIITAACAFIFNVKIQKDKSKERRRADHKIEKVEKKKNQYHSEILRKRDREEKKKDQKHLEIIRERDIEREKNEGKLDHYKKLNDPFWHYYDPEEGEFKTLPGKYGIDDPPPRPRGY